MSPARLRLALVWHLHQPWYRDAESGEFVLPWVRLHATRSYLDMPRVLAEFPNARATLNLVPSLLEQLELYAEGRARDRYLALTEKPAELLTPEERRFLLRNFFQVDWQTCIAPLPRYQELLHLRGTEPDRIDLDALARSWSVGALRDLQLLFNLAWMGFTAFEQEPALRALREKGRDFTEADKHELLALQRKLLGQVMPAMAAVAKSGQAELTVTPYFHPILPLLIDSDSARRNLQSPLPPRFQHPEDARLQIRRALDFAERKLGVRPKAMWPAEGSVSPEALELFASEGVRTLATDEGVLMRSEPKPQRSPDLWRTWRAATPSGAHVNVLFRDHGLSDLLGFTYQRTPAPAAIDDLWSHLGRIALQAPQGAREVPTVGVVLDGENPWEHYPESGRDFLRALYGALDSGRDGVEGVTLSGAFEASPPKRTLSRIHTGSWIDANFRIWIGHAEDVEAWTVLGQARAALATREAEGFDPARCTLAREALLVAEGSDWFWWYGDDFSTDALAEFDGLFRGWVRRALLALDWPLPAALEQPIARRVRKGGAAPVDDPKPPTRLASPPCDGTADSFLGWHGSALLEPGAGDRGAMQQGVRLSAGLRVAHDTEALHLRLDPLTTPEALLAEAHTLVLELGHAGRGERLTLKLDGRPARHEGRELGQSVKGRVWSWRLPLSALGLSPDESFSLWARLVGGPSGELERERLPARGALHLHVPGPAWHRGQG